VSLQDNMGRKFQYLRVSVTDACNYKCTYCLPNGYKPGAYANAVLSLEEIKNLVRGFASLGVFKVRLTGGEPTLRRDIVEIVAAVKAQKGIEHVALTTNGWRLEKIAKPLLEAGLSAVNVSIDSLDEESFAHITGRDELTTVLAGVEKCLALGFSKVKVNAVLMKSTFSQFSLFQQWIADKPISVRFIELMKTGENEVLFNQEHISGAILRSLLMEQGWNEVSRSIADGPAVEHQHPNFKGRIGLIAPYSKDFCLGCNRLRVTSRGDLRLCLFGEGKHSLRHLLSDECYDERQFQNCVFEALRLKKPSHFLNESDSGDTVNLSVYGG
jgi:GTP 3',8-cyclase